MRLFNAKYTCSGCSASEFPMMVIADDERDAAEQAKMQADLDCDQQHTIVSVEEDEYEPSTDH